MTSMTKQIPSLYTRLGGQEAVDLAVSAFYFNLLNDDRVSRFFEGVNLERLMSHQRRFLSAAFGGPTAYSGPNLARAHRHLVEEQGLNHEHFDVVISILATTLADLGIAANLVNEAIDTANSVRNEVIPVARQ